MGRYSTDAGFGSTDYPGPLLVHNNGHTIRVLSAAALPAVPRATFRPPGLLITTSSTT